jgi:hypothetical protein
VNDRTPLRTGGVASGRRGVRGAARAAGAHGARACEGSRCRRRRRVKDAEVFPCENRETPLAASTFFYGLGARFMLGGGWRQRGGCRRSAGTWAGPGAARVRRPCAGRLGSVPT